MDSIQINWLAVLVAVIANFIFGALWYMPLFGKVWAKEMKMNMTQKPPASVMVRGMLLGLIGRFFMVFVFAHNIAAWGCVKGTNEAGPAANALMAAAFTWLGFFVPVDLSGVAWEGKSWKLFFINTAYHFLQLLIVAIIFTHWKGSIIAPCVS